MRVRLPVNMVDHQRQVPDDAEYLEREDEESRDGDVHDVLGQDQLKTVACQSAEPAFHTWFKLRHCSIGFL